MHTWRGAAREPSWEEGLAALTVYVCARGTADVPSRGMAGGVLLGRWVAARREEFWSGTLAAARAATLQGLPGWVWGSDPHGESEGRTGWARGWGALRRYVEVHGAPTPPSAATSRGIRVGLWVDQQRAQYWAGSLSPARIALLQNLTGWTWTPPAQRWERGLRAAQDYIAANGTINTPKIGIVNGFPLGQWIARTHEDYRAGNLTPTQIAVLQALPGWAWSPREHSWPRGLAALNVYVGIHGNANPPQDTVSEGFPLGRWIADRRTAYRSGTLTPAQITALETLPGWAWNPREQSWLRGLAALNVYVGIHGNANPPQDTVSEGFPLGRWIADRRTAYRSGTLTPAQITALETLPGWAWNPREHYWVTGFAALGAYTDTHETAAVAYRTQVDGFLLGQWVARQRAAYRAGRLTPSRITALQALPGWSWTNVSRRDRPSPPGPRPGTDQ